MRRTYTKVHVIEAAKAAFIEGIEELKGKGKDIGYEVVHLSEGACFKINTDDNENFVAIGYVAGMKRGIEIALEQIEEKRKKVNSRKKPEPPTGPWDNWNHMASEMNDYYQELGEDIPYPQLYNKE